MIRAAEGKCPKSTRSPTLYKKFSTYDVKRRAERAIFLVIKMFQNDCFANESGWSRKKRMKKE
jgi:hypothetical protein